MVMDPEDLCLVGLGAVGVFYAYVLEASGKARVTAVCRSNLNILAETGVRLKLDYIGHDIPSWKPYRAVGTPAEAADRQYKYVVCCFKALPDIITTPELIGPLISKTTSFVLIQNGIGIELDLRVAAPQATIISACAWIDSTTQDGGHTIHQSNRKVQLFLGAHKAATTDREVDTARASQFADLITGGKSHAEATDNIDAQRWRKVLWNAAFSTICTMARTSVSNVLREDVLPLIEVETKELMREAIAVARREGVTPAELSDTAAQDVFDHCVRVHGAHVSPPSTFRPSMLVDLDHNRPIEVEAIVGGVIRKARKLGVQTPRLDVVYATLKVMQGDLIRQRAGQ